MNRQDPSDDESQSPQLSENQEAEAQEPELVPGDSSS